MVCIRLTSRHRCYRREWATEHVNWRRNEWSNVPFSDESRFSAHPDNKCIFIWRDRGSRNNSARTDLYIIRDGPLTARRYKDEILRPIVVPYAAAIGDDFILMDDNCRPHRANLVEDFLFEKGIVRMEWPACSSDMNPIEQVWDALGRRVAGCQPPPKTLQELERALLEEWDRIPQLVINSLIDSMPQRATGAAIYRKQNHSHVGTPHMDIIYPQTSGLGIASQDIGDICVAKCIFENGQRVISVAVYISPNQTVQKITDFLYFVLLPYAEDGSALLKTNYHSLPMILSGDFNVNFSLPEAEPLMAFLTDELKLEMNTNRNISATNSGTVIDAVFQRFLNTLKSQVSVSYFT
ncbi:transposable element Tcb1 transposase [Trichonephila clavipes]|nr:transposable element Tcb1 transposase [Trichonephila clavipes]